jgi:hypothetical protein
MLQTVIRSSIESARIALPRYSSAWPAAPAVPISALGREHVAQLARADAEGERPEGPVRAGVAVAADDRRARVRQAQLRADHVDDALACVPHREERDRELAAVALEGAHLLGRRPLGPRAPPVRAEPRRDRVIHRRHRPLRPPHADAARAQLGEGLRRGHLVDQVQVDVQDGGRLRRLRRHEVRVPDLVDERAGPLFHRAPQAAARASRAEATAER